MAAYANCPEPLGGGAVGLRRKLTLLGGFTDKQPGSPALLFVLVTILMLGLADTGYTRLRLPDTATALSGNSGADTLSLVLERRGTDLLLSWNRDTPTMLHATSGVVHVRDGGVLRRELRLNAAQLQNSNVLYTPVSTRVQFRMEVFDAGGRSITESILALSAPREATLAEQQDPPTMGYALHQTNVLYAVQVGTFRNRDNAERLRYEMEVQYGLARLVTEPSRPDLWRVVVGREASLERAGRLANRICTDHPAETKRALVIREHVSDST